MKTFNYRRYVRFAGLGLLFLLLFFLFYLFRPNVIPHSSNCGEPLPKAVGWDTDSINRLVRGLDEAPFISAFVAYEGEKEIFSYGDVDKPINLHSARKPIASLLIGMAQERGLLDLDETLGEMGVNESQVPLTPGELQATIRDLLMARSGVYLAAEAETAWMRNNRPKRGQYQPGEYFYYNNFDFNVLGTIIKKKTGMDIARCFYDWLAKPLGMQDFHFDHVEYGNPMRRENSDHRSYHLYLSARDLARIGILMINDGAWGGVQVVSPSWIKESTASTHSYNDPSKWPITDFGYCWTMDATTSNIWASGYGGQYLMIDTVHNLVLVQRNYTGNSHWSKLRHISDRKQGQRTDLMNVWYGLIRLLTQR